MKGGGRLRLFKGNMKRLIQRLYTIVITPLHAYGIVLVELLEKLHADLDKPGYTESIPFRAFTFCGTIAITVRALCNFYTFFTLHSLIVNVCNLCLA